LFGARLLRGDEGVGTGGFLDPPPLLPPLDEVAALGMNFIAAADADMIAPHTALAVEQRWRRLPFIVGFDLLEEGDAGHFAHLGGSSSEPPIDSPISVLNA